MGIAEKRKKIAIISPYFDILGGGEKYLLTIAALLSEKNSVTIFWDDSGYKDKVFKKLGIELLRVNFRKKLSGKFKLISVLRSFDVLVYMTDGSLFLSPCLTNILIIQSPAHIPTYTPGNRFKIFRFKAILCYSSYVSSFIKKAIHRNPVILPPFIDMPDTGKGKKENLILSVGRFFPWLHSKKQDVLVDVFKKMYDSGKISEWRLVIAGSVDKGAQEYVKGIKERIKGYPIEINNHSSFLEIVDLYQKAKIYWHASGYNQDLNKYPQNAEHFGITTVEAMCYGCVPVVFSGGGQLEIVTNGKNGYFWKTEEELLTKTIKLIEDNNLLNILRKEAIKRSKDYSQDNFSKRISDFI